MSAVTLEPAAGLLCLHLPLARICRFVRVVAGGDEGHLREAGVPQDLLGSPAALADDVRHRDGAAVLAAAPRSAWESVPWSARRSGWPAASVGAGGSVVVGGASVMLVVVGLGVGSRVRVLVPVEQPPEHTAQAEQEQEEQQEQEQEPTPAAPGGLLLLGLGFGFLISGARGRGTAGGRTTGGSATGRGCGRSGGGGRLGGRGGLRRRRGLRPAWPVAEGSPG